MAVIKIQLKIFFWNLIIYNIDFSKTEEIEMTVGSLPCIDNVIMVHYVWASLLFSVA